MDCDENIKKECTPVEILGFHAQYERSLSRLYKLFSKKMPELELWPYLVEEEIKHECWIMQMIPKVVEGTIILKVLDYSAKFVREHTEMLNARIEQLKGEEIDLQKALRICVEYENYMLDRDFFGNLISDAPAIQSVIDKLIIDTENHRDEIKRAINEL